MKQRTISAIVARVTATAEEMGALGQAHLADKLKHSLDQMQRRDPGRYAAPWRGTLDVRVGKGALGRRMIDRAVRFGSKKDGAHQA